MKVTIDELDVFNLSGPTYLVESGETWIHPISLRAAMTCLVQAVYALERDRSSVSPMQLTPLAPDWHLPFKYKLVKTLHDAEGSNPIVGAVFKWSRRLRLLRAGAAPKIVIAFRGTMPFGDSWKSDLRADLGVLLLQLHKAPRFLVALREVEQAVARYGAGKVCLTGHSLGAAVCLLVGRMLALRNCFVDAHLFSPPFPSLTPCLSPKKAIAAAFGKAASVWRPHLYVNTHDPICAAYVHYFRELEDVKVRHDRRSEDNQGNFPGLRGLVQMLAGREAMPFHLIPSAYLYTTDAVKGFKKAHGIQQWYAQETLHMKSQFVSFAAST